MSHEPPIGPPDPWQRFCRELTMERHAPVPEYVSPGRHGRAVEVRPISVDEGMLNRLELARAAGVPNDYRPTVTAGPALRVVGE